MDGLDRTERSSTRCFGTVLKALVLLWPTGALLIVMRLLAPNSELPDVEVVDFAKEIPYFDIEEEERERVWDDGKRAALASTRAPHKSCAVRSHGSVRRSAPHCGRLR